MICPLKISIGVWGSVAMLLLASSLAAKEPAAGGKLHVYFGTYTGAKSQGIYHAVLDLASGQLSAPNWPPKR